MENAIETTHEWTETEMTIGKLFAELDDAAKVFFYELMKGLANGVEMESILIHQPVEYKKILDETGSKQLFDAVPLMRYILAKGKGWGETLTLAMAYRTGIADGKRLERARRAQGKKVPA